MAGSSTDRFKQGSWRVNPRRAGNWRSWDGEIVIYDDISGDTLKLDVILAEAFRFLLQAPATRAQLTDHLASVFDLESGQQLRSLATLALRKFTRSGVIEQVCDGDDVPL